MSRWLFQLSYGPVIASYVRFRLSCNLVIYTSCLMLVNIYFSAGLNTFLLDGFLNFLTVFASDCLFRSLLISK